jgi:hypothetical protein
VEENFNFREDDTIAIISRTCYSQNKAVKWNDSSFENISKDLTDQVPPVLQHSNEAPILVSDEIIVRHCLEFDKVRLLYTTRIQELMVHHLVRGFNFK